MFLTRVADLEGSKLPLVIAGYEAMVGDRYVTTICHGYVCLLDAKFAATTITVNFVSAEDYEYGLCTPSPWNRPIPKSV